MRIWTKTDGQYKEDGKFLVVRRDGTVFKGPHFVLGPRDPAAPAALLEGMSKVTFISPLFSCAG